MPEAKEPILLSEAWEIVDRVLGGMRLPAESVPVRRAIGRVLACDQASRLDLPPFDKSAMDGYAVLAGDDREEYRVVGSVQAGMVHAEPLRPGTALRIMTGAPVPRGAGRVIPFEQASVAGDVVRVRPDAGKPNICLRGEDIRRGEVILRAGVGMGPLEIANLLACGISEVEVVRRVRAAIVSTGDEIVESPDELAPGKILNANGPLLAGLCHEYGMDVVGEGLVRDDPDATVTAIRDATDRADIVVLSGGVSEGDFDCVGASMAQTGLRVQFNRVAVKPGRPLTFASGPGKAVFGLPGNPVSVFLMFHLFVLRAARLMAGSRAEHREFMLPMGQDFHRRKSDRVEYLPCRLGRDGVLEPVRLHGSGDLAAVLGADGFFAVPRGVAGLSAGERAGFLPTRKALA